MRDKTRSVHALALILASLITAVSVPSARAATITNATFDVSSGIALASFVSLNDDFGATAGTVFQVVDGNPTGLTISSWATDLVVAELAATDPGDYFVAIGVPGEPLAFFTVSVPSWTPAGLDVVFENGRVGIGTFSPTEALDVAGNVIATSFIGDGANLTGIDAETVDGRDGAALQQRVAAPCPSGSAVQEIHEDGTVGCQAVTDTLGVLTCALHEIARWDGAAWVCSAESVDGRWTQSGTDLHYTAGAVGVGTASPTSALQVNGYAQLDTTRGTPPVADCDDPSEYGRMKVDSEQALLDVCAESGWVQVALAPAPEPGCEHNRYEDQGDGTVLDCATDLLWLKDASCADLPLTNSDGRAQASAAQDSAALLADGTCGLTDGSEAGDWRLPTIDEFCSAGEVWGICPEANASDSLIDSSVGPPTVTDTEGHGTWTEGDPFVGLIWGDVLSDRYWSSNVIGGDTAWCVGLRDGLVEYDLDVSLHLWPVREKR